MACSSLTAAAISLLCASSACFCSPCACATCLPIDFCCARSCSNSVSEERRLVSAARIASTIPSSSPRARWLARTRSGSSRRSLMSITGSAYRGLPGRPTRDYPLPPWAVGPDPCGMPSTPTLGAFALAATALILLPGPAMLFLVSRGIGQGRRAAVASMAGIETATAVMVLGDGVRTVRADQLLGAGLLDREVRRRGLPGLPGDPGVPQPRALRAQRPTGHQLAPSLRGRLRRRHLEPQDRGVLRRVLPAVPAPRVRPDLVAGARARRDLRRDRGGLRQPYALSAGSVGNWLKRHPQALDRQRFVSGGIFLAMGGASALTGHPSKA